MNATIRASILTALAVAALAGCKKEEATAPAGAATAKAVLASTEGHAVKGTVTLTQEADGKVTITTDISGLSPGKQHGFHIHEKGDCSAPDAKSAGGHFNPHGADHGGPDSAKRHAGDFGNLTADADGAAKTSFVVAGITLKDGDADSAIGKAFIVHAGTDDLKSQPSGAAGPRAACGVIAAP